MDSFNWRQAGLSILIFALLFGTIHLTQPLWFGPVSEYFNLKEKVSQEAESAIEEHRVNDLRRMLN